MTTATRTPAWAVGQRPSVRVSDSGLSDDLRLLAEHHGTVSDALRAAVRQAAAITRGELLAIPGRGPIAADLQLLARAGLPDASDAVRWAVDHAAQHVSDRWHAERALPTLTPVGEQSADTTDAPTDTDQPQEDRP